MRKSSKAVLITDDPFRNDRVRAHSDPSLNERIDAETDHRLKLYAKQSSDVIQHRLNELDREWDMERVVETNASSLILGGLALGAVWSRKWFFVPFTVAGFLLQHALQGWCPPMGLFRQRGVRTRSEIERERAALKALLVHSSSVHTEAGPDEQSTNGGDEPKPRHRPRH